ncbi:MAG: hypothetical protein WAW61_08885 [Methylococcaceae bacterium]
MDKPEGGHHRYDGLKKAMAKRIVEGGADTILALKDDQPALHEDVKIWLDNEIGAG